MSGRPIRLKKSTMSKDFSYPLNEEREKRKLENRKVRESKKLKMSQRTIPMRVNQEKATVRPKTPPAPPLAVSPEAPTQMSKETQTNQMSKEDILNEIYTNPNFPSAYSGDLKKFLQQKESLSRHRKRRHVFKRRQVKVGGPYSAVQADTIFYRDYARQNDGYKYILGEGYK